MEGNNLFVSETLTQIERFLRGHTIGDELKELLLILKAEIQVAPMGVITTLAVAARLSILTMLQAVEASSDRKKAEASTKELQSKVAGYSAQVRSLNDKIQQFQSQENRFYHTIECMHEGMLAAKKIAAAEAKEAKRNKVVTKIAKPRK